MICRWFRIRKRYAYTCWLRWHYTFSCSSVANASNTTVRSQPFRNCMRNVHTLVCHAFSEIFFFISMISKSRLLQIFRVFRHTYKSVRQPLLLSYFAKTLKRRTFSIKKKSLEPFSLMNSVHRLPSSFIPSVSQYCYQSTNFADKIAWSGSRSIFKVSYRGDRALEYWWLLVDGQLT